MAMYHSQLSNFGPAERPNRARRGEFLAGLPGRCDAMIDAALCGEWAQVRSLAVMLARSARAFDVVVVATAADSVVRATETRLPELPVKRALISLLMSLGAAGDGSVFDSVRRAG